LILVKGAEKWSRCASALVTPHCGMGTRTKYGSRVKYCATVKDMWSVSPTSSFFSSHFLTKIKS